MIPSFVLVCTCMALRILSLFASWATTSSAATIWSGERGLIMYAQCSGAHCLDFCWILLKNISSTRGRDVMVSAIFMYGGKIW
jgi:hypothetical protein